jgi:hypothetical protein
VDGETRDILVHIFGVRKSLSDFLHLHGVLALSSGSCNAHARQAHQEWKLLVIKSGYCKRQQWLLHRTDFGCLYVTCTLRLCATAVTGSLRPCTSHNWVQVI